MIGKPVFSSLSHLWNSLFFYGLSRHLSWPACGYSFCIFSLQRIKETQLRIMNLNMKPKFFFSLWSLSKSTSYTCILHGSSGHPPGPWPPLILAFSGTRNPGLSENYQERSHDSMFHSSDNSSHFDFSTRLKVLWKRISAFRIKFGIEECKNAWTVLLSDWRT